MYLWAAECWKLQVRYGALTGLSPSLSQADLLGTTHLLAIHLATNCCKGCCFGQAVSESNQLELAVGQVELTAACAAFGSAALSAALIVFD